MEPIPVKTTNLCEVLSFYVQFKEYLSSDFAGGGLYNYCAWLKRYGFWDESSHVVKLGLTVLSSGKLANLYWNHETRNGEGVEWYFQFRFLNFWAHMQRWACCHSWCGSIGPRFSSDRHAPQTVTLRLCTLTLLVLPAPPMSLQVGSRCVQ